MEQTAAQIATRFPANRPEAPNNQKHPNGYLLPKLKKLLNGKMRSNDPKIVALLEEVGLPHTIATWLLMRLCLNGTEGETKAIVEIMDRIDGKVAQTVKNEGEGLRPVIIVRTASAPVQDAEEVPAGSIRDQVKP